MQMRNRQCNIGHILNNGTMKSFHLSIFALDKGIVFIIKLVTTHDASSISMAKD